MAKKGGSSKNKRISLPTARHVSRKKHVWAIKPMPGPHNHQRVVPLGELVREQLGLASNRKELKAVLHTKKVLVDEKVRIDMHFSVGLFDIVRIDDEEKKRYRVVFDSKGRLYLREMKEKENAIKVCKVIQKKVLGKDRIQLTMMDGRTFIEKTAKTKIGDSLVIELPSQKIVQILSRKEGNQGYLLSGTHTGTIARIGPLSKASLQKDALVEMQSTDEKFQTLAENVIVIGEKKPVIALE